MHRPAAQDRASREDDLCGAGESFDCSHTLLFFCGIHVQIHKMITSIDTKSYPRKIKTSLK